MAQTGRLSREVLAAATACKCEALEMLVRGAVAIDFAQLCSVAANTGKCILSICSKLPQADAGIRALSDPSAQACPLEARSNLPEAS